MLRGWSRDFRHVLAAFAVSSLGTKIAREAVPLTAVLVLQAGPGSLGLLGAAATLPSLAFGLFAGVWVDRLRRRPVMILADLVRFLALVSVPLAAWFGLLSLVQLLVVIAVVATSSLLFIAADAAYLPELVAPERLVGANATRETIDATAEIVGPPIGGALVQAIAAPAAVLVDALSYLLSAAALLRVRRELPPAPTERRHVLADIREGLRALWQQPILRPLLYARAIRSFFGSMIGPFYVLYVIRHLGISPGGMGVIIGCGGLAALAGATLVPWLNARVPRGAGTDRRLRDQEPGPRDAADGWIAAGLGGAAAHPAASAAGFRHQLFRRQRAQPAAEAAATTSARPRGGDGADGE
jgi:MFS family permease